MLGNVFSAAPAAIRYGTAASIVHGKTERNNVFLLADWRNGGPAFGVRPVAFDDEPPPLDWFLKMVTWAVLVGGSWAMVIGFALVL